MKRIRPTLSAALLAVAIGVVRAQTTSPGQAARLPDVIRLVLRGRVGDAYVINTASHGEFAFTTTLPDSTAQKNAMDEKENKVRTKRVRAVTQGNVKIESHTVSGQKTEMEDGASKTTPAAPEDYVEVFAPNFKRLSRVKLAPPKATTKGKKNPGAASAPAKDEDEMLENPSFPDKTLRVGDTWQGTTPMRLPNMGSQALTYTAKLAAIEMRQSLPCAKVEYTVSMNADKLPKQALGDLPPNARASGQFTIEGTITGYYRLDRGTLAETGTSIRIALRFEITVPNPDGGNDVRITVEGNGEYSGKDVTTKGPAYDASLVTPVSDSAAPSP